MKIGRETGPFKEDQCEREKVERTMRRRSSERKGEGKNKRDKCNNKRRKRETETRKEGNMKRGRERERESRQKNAKKELLDKGR